jgi:dCMP deaminase
MPRISRDEMFIRIADIVALRSTCDRARVGALLVKDNRIISVGYNGSAPGEPHCDEVGHLMSGGHCVRTLHAEKNAIQFATGLFAVGLGGLTLYCTHFPCMGCTLEIIKTSFLYKETGRGIGIDKVVYKVPYGEEELIRHRIMMMEGQGIEVVQFTGYLVEPEK